MLYSSCKVCSHTVAIAYHTHSSPKYLKWLQKQRGTVSLSVLANANMPKGAGKKPNARRKASSKTASKRIKELLADADCEQFTPRVKKSIKKVASSDEHIQVYTPELCDDMPGPSAFHTCIRYHCALPILLPPLLHHLNTTSHSISYSYNLNLRLWCLLIL